MAKPTGIKMPPASKLVPCSSADVVVVIIDREDAQSKLCDPNHGGCGNFRPRSSFVHQEIESPFDQADSLMAAAAAEKRKLAAAKSKKHLDSPAPKPAALTINKDRLCAHCNRDAFRRHPAPGDDLICCRSEHHPADVSGKTNAPAFSFRLREPCVQAGNGDEHFRTRRVPVCNDCIDAEIAAGTYDRALYGKWDESTTSSNSDESIDETTKKPLSKGKSRAAAKAEVNKPTKDEGPQPPIIDLTAPVLPLAYFPPVPKPPQAVRRDHIKTDYFALSPQGKIQWWCASIERALQKTRGEYLPEKEEMEKLLRILSGEEKAECGTCGETKTLERGFAIRVFVDGAGTNKRIVLEAGDECLSCQW